MLSGSIEGVKMKKERLNLGCGLDYRKGWLNVDSRADIKVDLKYNLNKLPYPFKKNQFSEVYAEDLIEHLDDPIGFLKELARVVKPGGIVTIITTHAQNYAYLTNIQHKARFTEQSFSKDLLDQYELSKNLKLVEFRWVFNHKWKKLIPLKKYLKIFLNGLYDEMLFKFKVI